jgi:hypothetical protein
MLRALDYLPFEEVRGLWDSSVVITPLTTAPRPLFYQQD